MAWDPAVLRRYNTTGHFKLLSQLRTELKSSPLQRPGPGETVGDANRSKSLTRWLEGRQAGAGRNRRGAAVQGSGSDRPDQADPNREPGLRGRLNTVELR